MKKIIFTIFLVAIALATSYSSTTKKIPCAKCETDWTLCNNGVLTGVDGRPQGCSRDWFEWGPDPCDEDCYRCTAGSSDDFCLRDTTAQGCMVPTGGTYTVTCGNKKKFGCGGLWKDGCSCPTTGGVLQTTACEPDKCLG
jgi:hypothetical protein